MLTTIQNRRRTRQARPRGARARRGGDLVVHFRGRSQALRRRRAGAEARQRRSRRTSPTCGPRCCRACSARRGATTIAASAIWRSSKSGQVFLSDKPEGQRTYATGASGAGGAPTTLAGQRQALGVFDAKADLAARARCPGARHRQAAAGAPSRAAWSHPGRGGRVQLGPTS